MSVGTGRLGPPHYSPLMPWFGVTLHLFWAALLIVNSDVQHVTALAHLTDIASRGVIASMLVIVALLAAWAITHHGFLLLLPQQMVMVMSAVSAVVTISEGKYPDGTVPASPHLFILTDQWPVIVIAAFHTIAVVSRGREPWR